jgi:hypothetical protein
LISGVDVFIKIWSEMPAYRWLSRLVALRPIRFIGAVVYDHVAVPFLAYWNERRKARERQQAENRP